MISIPLDKQAHFLAGMAICAMFMPFGLGISFAVAFGAAAAKEVYDYFFGGTVDPCDVFATMSGATAFVLWVQVLQDGFGVIW